MQGLLPKTFVRSCAGEPIKAGQRQGQAKVDPCEVLLLPVCELLPYRGAGDALCPSGSPGPQGCVIL